MKRDQNKAKASTQGNRKLLFESVLKIDHTSFIEEQTERQVARSLTQTVVIATVRGPETSHFFKGFEERKLF